MYTGSALYTTETDYRIEMRARTRLSEVAGSQPESTFLSVPCLALIVLHYCPKDPTGFSQGAPYALVWITPSYLAIQALFQYSVPNTLFIKSKLLGQAIDVILNFAVLSDGLLQFLPWPLHHLGMEVERKTYQNPHTFRELRITFESNKVTTKVSVSLLFQSFMLEQSKDRKRLY